MTKNWKDEAALSAKPGRTGTEKDIALELTSTEFSLMMPTEVTLRKPCHSASKEQTTK